MHKPRYLAVLDASPASNSDGPSVADVEQGESSYSARYLCVVDYAGPADRNQGNPHCVEFEMPRDAAPAYVQECDVAGLIDLYHEALAQDDLLTRIDDIAIERPEQMSSTNQPSDELSKRDYE